MPPRTPTELRTHADYLTERATEAAKKNRPEQAAFLLIEAAEAREEAERLERLTGANRKRTVQTSMAGAAAADEWRKPPTLRELATMLGCTHGFLSQARSGATRIRMSWAARIAAVRPDLPATKKTWPKGWAPEPEEG